jgi:hypothetical protein
MTVLDVPNNGDNNSAGTVCISAQSTLRGHHGDKKS